MKTLTKRILGWSLIVILLIAILLFAYFGGIFKELVAAGLSILFVSGISILIIWLLISD